MNMDLKTFTKSQLKKEIQALEKKINKLETSIKNNNEILEQNKILKQGLESQLSNFKHMEQFI